MKKSVLVISLVLSLSGFSQIPQLYQKQNIGGTLRDNRPLLLRSPDNSVLLAGFGNSVDGDFVGTSNSGGDDIKVIKLDPCGGVVWKKNYGGSGNEQVFGISPTIEGGVLITGNTSSANIPNFHGGVTDGYVCKTDKDGNLEWIKCFGGSGLDNLNNSVSLPDGSLVVAGSTSSPNGDAGTIGGDFQGWILKLDNDGNLIWKKLLGGIFAENFSGITATTDGNFMLCGYRATADNIHDIWLVKVGPTGNMIWEKTFGGAGSENSFLVRPVNGNGYIITAQTTSTDLAGHHGGMDALILRVDNNGNLLWQKCVGGSGADQLNSVSLTADNQFLFAANSNSADGDVPGNRGGQDAFVFALDDGGNIIWTKTFGGSLADLFTDVAIDNDGSVILSGVSNSSDGDIDDANGQSDFILFKFRETKVRDIDSGSCSISSNIILLDTIPDQCGYDSIINRTTIYKTDKERVMTISDKIIAAGESVKLITLSTAPVEWEGPGLSCYNCLQPIAQPPFTTTYIVKTGSDQCFAADTVTIHVLPKDTLYVPTAFTPNKDGLNDRFMVRGSVTDYHLRIFNRWGEAVFESRSLQNGWDGKVSGAEQSTGIYVYIIQYKTSLGITRILKGTLTLIR